MYHIIQIITGNLHYLPRIFSLYRLVKLSNSSTPSFRSNTYNVTIEIIRGNGGIIYTVESVKFSLIKRIKMFLTYRLIIRLFIVFLSPHFPFQINFQMAGKGLNDEQVAQEMNKMVAFIKQEALEKAREIKLKVNYFNLDSSLYRFYRLTRNSISKRRS